MMWTSRLKALGRPFPRSSSRASFSTLTCQSNNPKGGRRKFPVTLGCLGSQTTSKFSPLPSRLSVFSEETSHWHIPVRSNRQRPSAIAALGGNVHVLTRKPLGIHSYWNMSSGDAKHEGTQPEMRQSWQNLDEVVPFDNSIPQLASLPNLGTTGRLALFIPSSQVLVAFDPTFGEAMAVRLPKAELMKRGKNFKPETSNRSIFDGFVNRMMSGSDGIGQSGGGDVTMVDALAKDNELVVTHGFGADAFSLVKFKENSSRGNVSVDARHVFAPSGMSFGEIRPVSSNVWIAQVFARNADDPEWHWLLRRQDESDGFEFDMKLMDRQVLDDPEAGADQLVAQMEGAIASPAQSGTEMTMHHPAAFVQRAVNDEGGDSEKLAMQVWTTSREDHSSVLLCQALEIPAQLFTVRKPPASTLDSSIQMNKAGGRKNKGKSKSKTTPKSGDQESSAFIELVDVNGHTCRRIEPRAWDVNDKVEWVGAAECGNGRVATLEASGPYGLVRMWQLDETELEGELRLWRHMVGIGADDKGGLQLKRASQGGESLKPPAIDAPKHGKEDSKNEPHVGGNTWAGGTGGSNTAGLGGRGGPYRLDKGHPVHQVTDEAKAEVDEETARRAREMGQKALEERLKEIAMTTEENEYYHKLYSRVEQQVGQLRVVLEGMESKLKERVWLRHQSFGDLDDSKLVDGMAGERLVFKRRGEEEATPGAPQALPKRLRFVVDVSGSMYRFNGEDGRLERMCEMVVMLMESLEGFEDRLQYSVVGHSGEDEAIPLVDYGAPPRDRKERLQVVLRMVAHAQFCLSGDSTLEATDAAIEEVASEPADDYFVFVVSDANLRRYGIQPRHLGQRLVQNSDVKAYAVFVASFGEEAEELREALPAGRGFTCYDTADLPQMFRQIFTSQVLG